MRNGRTVMWIELKEILGLGGLPATLPGITKKAKLENWERRRKQGVKGNVYEYSFSSLPLEVQTEYLLKHSEDLKVNKENNDSNQPIIESAWNVLASVTFEQEKRAERRFQAVVKVARLVENKIPLMKAFEQVVALYATDSDDETISKGSLKRWWYKVKTHPQGIWLPLLLDRTERDNSCRWADISDKAWAFFCADYLRKSKPKFSVCYYRLTLAAEENDWTIPSLSSLKRKFYNEFTEAEIALARGGEHELRELTAPQIRTVMDLEVYEIVNGDGYQHNVFVDWYEDGRPPIRPKTILMDNTRAASDKQTTQQRKRGKRQTAGIKIDGMFDRLGIKVIRTLVFKGRGNGRAKPIERAFKRDSLPAYVDGDARLEAFLQAGQ